MAKVSTYKERENFQGPSKRLSEVEINELYGDNSGMDTYLVAKVANEEQQSDTKHNTDKNKGKENSP